MVIITLYNYIKINCYYTHVGNFITFKERADSRNTSTTAGFLAVVCNINNVQF